MGILKTCNKILKSVQRTAEVVEIKADNLKNEVAIDCAIEIRKKIRKLVSKYDAEQARKIVETAYAYEGNKQVLKAILEEEIKACQSSK